MYKNRHEKRFALNPKCLKLIHYILVLKKKKRKTEQGTQNKALKNKIKK